MKFQRLTLTLAVAGTMFICNGNASAQTSTKNCKPTICFSNNSSTTGNAILELPGKEEIYYFEYDGITTYLDRIFTRKYNDNGKVILLQEDIKQYDDSFLKSRTSFTYNSNDMLSGTEYEEYDNMSDVWNKTKYSEISYDETCSDVINNASYFAYDIYEGAWVPDYNEYSFYKNIVRDEKGRVISNEDWSDKTMTMPSCGYTFEYGENDHAKKMYMTFSMQDETGSLVLKPTMLYDNIKWYRSNNQYLYWYAEDPNNIFVNDTNNLPLSYDVYYCDLDGNQTDLAASFSAEYDDQDRIIKCVIADKTYNTTTQINYQYEGSNKNYSVKELLSWYDDGNGTLDEGEDINRDERCIRTFDEFGNLLTEEEFYTDSYDNSEYQSGGKKYEYVYEEGARMTEKVYSEYNEYDSVYSKLSKTIYSDFVSTHTGMAGVNSTGLEINVMNNGIILSDGSSTTYRIYDMQGVVCKHGGNTSFISTESLAKGMYVIEVFTASGKAAVKFVKK